MRAKQNRREWAREDECRRRRWKRGRRGCKWLRDLSRWEDV